MSVNDSSQTINSQVADPDSALYLAALASEHEALGTNYESVDQVTAALLGISIGLGVTVFAFLSQSCELPGLKCTPKTWAPLYAFLPMVSFVGLSLLGHLGNVKTVKMYYSRALESEMQRLSLSPEVSFAGGEPVRLPAFGHLAVGLFSQRRGKFRYKILLSISYVTIIALQSLITFLSLWIATPIDFQIFMGAVYTGISIILLRVLWLGSLGSRQLWREATMASAWRESTSSGPDDDSNMTQGPQSRSIWSYLALPRPHDLLAKIWVIPSAWAIGATQSSFTLKNFLLLITVMLVFEFVLYQARYMINDLRGISTDHSYSAYKKLNRFPSPAKKLWVQAALWSAAIRFGFTLWIGIRVIPTPAGTALTAAALALAVQASLYEWAKTRFSEASKNPPYGISIGDASIYLLVGFGYSIRAFLGYNIALSGSIDFGEQAALLTMYAAFGTMSVTMAWAMTAAMQLGSISEYPSSRFSDRMLTTTHLLPLAREAGLIATSSTPAQIPLLAEDERRAVARKRFLVNVSVLTWWNASYIVFSSTSCLLGLLLAGDKSGGPLLVAAAILGGIVAVLVVQAHAPGRLRSRIRDYSLVPSALTLVLLSLLLWTVMAYAVDIYHSTSMAVGIVISGFLYLSFRGTNLRAMEVHPREVVDRIRSWIGSLINSLIRLVIGVEANRVRTNRKP